ncbi:MAG: hypothetical protein HOP29_06660 [Phycisphaerales bacterium]|nr:hypothetical protein [Phycisphaerales bacterium]
MIRILLPSDLEERLRRDLGDLDRAAKEALLLQAFRDGKLTHYELGRALDLDRFDTDAVLKRHNIFEGSPTLEDLEADQRTVDGVLGPIR